MASRVGTNRREDERKQILGGNGTGIQGRNGSGTTVKRSTGAGTNLATRIGQNNQQSRQVTSAQTDQAIVKPAKKPTTIGRGTARIPGKLTPKEAFRLSDPGPIDPSLTSAQAVKKAGIGTLPPAAETKGEAIGRLALKKDPKVTPPRFDLQIRGTGAKKKKDFNILNFEGIENIFSSAGDLAAFFSSPEFQKEQRQARGRTASAKSRISELKSLDSSIKAISSALGGLEFSEDEALKTTLSTQLGDLSRQREEISAGAGGALRGGNLDLQTPEGFLTFLSGKNIGKDERLSITRRIFADGA